MKVTVMISAMAVSLLLPLAGTYARVAPNSAADLRSSGDYQQDRAAEDGAVKRRGRHDRGSKASDNRGSKGSKGSKGTASPS